ncbi:MAG: hypothetical protein ABJA02_03410 [Acidobacteriota bacterium]
MDSLKKYTIIVIRLQALGFILAGVIYWIVIAGLIVIASLQSVPSNVSNLSPLVLTGLGYLLVGIILYARSRSLADYFVRAVENV